MTINYFLFPEILQYLDSKCYYCKKEISFQSKQKIKKINNYFFCDFYCVKWYTDCIPVPMKNRYV